VVLTDASARTGSQGRPFHGPPDAVAVDLRRYQAVGVERFVLSFGAGEPGELVVRLRRFAEEVRPALAPRSAG
jgi:hypothetical protein